MKVVLTGEGARENRARRLVNQTLDSIAGRVDSRIMFQQVDRVGAGRRGHSTLIVSRGIAALNRLFKGGVITGGDARRNGSDWRTHLPG